MWHGLRVQIRFDANSAINWISCTSLAASNDVEFGIDEESSDRLLVAVGNSLVVVPWCLAAPLVASQPVADVVAVRVQWRAWRDQAFPLGPGEAGGQGLVWWGSAGLAASVLSDGALSVMRVGEEAPLAAILLPVVPHGSGQRPSRVLSLLRVPSRSAAMVALLRDEAKLWLLRLSVSAEGSEVALQSLQLVLLRARAGGAWAMRLLQSQPGPAEEACVLVAADGKVSARPLTRLGEVLFRLDFGRPGPQRLNLLLARGCLYVVGAQRSGSLFRQWALLVPLGSGCFDRSAVRSRGGLDLLGPGLALYEPYKPLLWTPEPLRPGCGRVPLPQHLLELLGRGPCASPGPMASPSSCSLLLASTLRVPRRTPPPGPAHQEVLALVDSSPSPGLKTPKAPGPVLWVYAGRKWRALDLTLTSRHPVTFLGPPSPEEPSRALYASPGPFQCLALRWLDGARALLLTLRGPDPFLEILSRHCQGSGGLGAGYVRKSVRHLLLALPLRPGPAWLLDLVEPAGREMLCLVTDGQTLLALELAPEPRLLWAACPQGPLDLLSAKLLLGPGPTGSVSAVLLDRAGRLLQMSITFSEPSLTLLSPGPMEAFSVCGPGEVGAGPEGDSLYGDLLLCGPEEDEAFLLLLDPEGPSLALPLPAPEALGVSRASRRSFRVLEALLQAISRPLPRPHLSMAVHLAALLLSPRAGEGPFQWIPELTLQLEARLLGGAGPGYRALCGLLGTFHEPLLIELLSSVGRKMEPCRRLMPVRLPLCRAGLTAVGLWGLALKRGRLAQSARLLAPACDSLGGSSSGPSALACLLLASELLLRCCQGLSLRIASDTLQFLLRLEQAFSCLGPEEDLLSRALQLIQTALPSPGPSTCGPEELLQWLEEGQGCAAVDTEPYYPGKGILSALADLLRWAVRGLPQAPQASSTGPTPLKGEVLEQVQGMIGESCLQVLSARGSKEGGLSWGVLGQAVTYLLSHGGRIYSAAVLMASLGRSRALRSSLGPHLRVRLGGSWPVEGSTGSEEAAARVCRVLVVFRLSRACRGDPEDLRVLLARALDLQTVRRAVEAEMAFLPCEPEGQWLRGSSSLDPLDPHPEDHHYPNPNPNSCNYFELPEDFFCGPATVLHLVRALCVCFLLAGELTSLDLLLRRLGLPGPGEDLEALLLRLLPDPDP